MLSTRSVSVHGLMGALGVGFLPRGGLSFCGETRVGAPVLNGFSMIPADLRSLMDATNPIRQDFWLGHKKGNDAPGLKPGNINATIPVIGGNVAIFMARDDKGLQEEIVTIGAFAVNSPTREGMAACIAAYVGSNYVWTAHGRTFSLSATWLAVLALKTGTMRVFDTRAKGGRTWREAKPVDLRRFAGCLRVAEENADNAVRGLLTVIQRKTNVKPMRNDTASLLLQRDAGLTKRSSIRWER